MILRHGNLVMLAGLISLLAAGKTSIAEQLVFIDTGFENASPLDWEVLDDGAVRVDLLYDHERDSPNRAAGHWHFRVEAEPDSELTIVLNHLSNVWNGRSAIAGSDATITFTSPDGKSWEAQQTEFIRAAGQLKFTVKIPASGSLWIARLPPYRISDLDRFLDEIRQHPLVEITPIGHTLQGRPLEIVRVGREDAPYRVFLRARAHPWEPGGNWVLEGMLRHLLATADDKDVSYLNRFCIYVMPMANKDGVANGRTRFNMLGKDLNRDWNAPPDPKLCPENVALENWLTTMLESGRRPHLALEMHNDESGKLHLSRPVDTQLDAYLARMKRFENLLREKTWFREGATDPHFQNSGTLGEGWLRRFGIDAVVHELNANWIAGLQSPPSAEHWMLYGRQLCDVFDAYFE